MKLNNYCNNADFTYKTNNYINHFPLKIEDLRIAIQKLEEEEKSFITLWRSVINQAFTDLKSKSHKSESIKLFSKAKTFLTGFSEDFLEVCNLAQLNPQHISDKAWKIIDQKFLKDSKK